MGGSRTDSVLTTWGSMWLVVEGLWTWYKRNWKATAISSMLLPVMFLLAFGLGLGSQIDASATAGAIIGNATYLQFIAPALLGAAAMQNAVMESTFPVYSAFKWSKVYWGITSTPISPAQICYGQLLWIGLRVFASGAIYLAAIVIFGGAYGPGIVFALLFATLCGVACAAPVIALSAGVRSESGPFNALFRFVVMPMLLFSGTFFPLSELPAVIRPLAWISPLWHSTELARGTTLGGLEIAPALGHTAFLLALLVTGLLLARRQFIRRLGG